MLTKTANELIGKRVWIRDRNHDQYGLEGHVDRVDLDGTKATIRIILLGGNVTTAEEDQVDHVNDPPQITTEALENQRRETALLDDGPSETTGAQDIRKEVWRKVFDVVSDMAYANARELIRLLERARDADGCGPYPDAKIPE
jgi:hypothetical protein